MHTGSEFIIGSLLFEPQLLDALETILADQRETEVKESSKRLIVHWSSKSLFQATHTYASPIVSGRTVQRAARSFEYRRAQGSQSTVSISRCTSSDDLDHGRDRDERIEHVPPHYLAHDCRILLIDLGF